MSAEARGGVSLRELQARAAAVRAALSLPPHSDAQMRIDLAFSRIDGSTRGWANWLVPGFVMAGRYPHLDPIAAPPRAGARAFTGGPSADEVGGFLSAILSTPERRLDAFVCLQDELPAQDRAEAWPADGRVYLASAEARARFPGPFVRYHDAVLAATPAGRRPPGFAHYPIVDLSLPESVELTYALLAELLERLPAGALYVHCWGGRGRAGLIGGALLACLRPEMDGAEVVRAVQAGYDTRAGAKDQKGSLARSPQTPDQREWLAAFADALRAA
jgi:alanine transaminase